MENSSLMLNLSVLQRNVQKYFDKALARYGIGYGQLMYLFFINENEGITMQEVSRIGEVDKGTTTKSVQKLMEQEYVRQKQDENDHRIKRLYTTKKTAAIINDLYEMRNACRNLLAEDVDLKAFEAMLAIVADHSRNHLPQAEDYGSLRIGGLQRVTLLDYPDKVAATVFMAGCNMKCPYCHNRELVFVPEGYAFMDPEVVLDYLKKRRGLLDGVCISGGEPLLQEGLFPFLRSIRDLGFAVKIDTNGTYPDRLAFLLEENLVDYVAMDIKNTPEKYAETIGLDASVFDLTPIRKSVQILMDSEIEYEFRTTVVREFHTEADLTAMAQWIQGARHYFLQQYRSSGNVIQKGLHAYSRAEMEQALRAVQKIIPHAVLRGIKEEETCTKS